MSEHDEQTSVFAWKNMLQNKYVELGMLFAVPNAGKRSIGAARYYLAEGLQPGVPDIFLPVPKNGKCGLVIEMKVKPNKVTPEQKWWLASLESFGWKTSVCYSADEAIKVVCDYLGIEDAYG